jgi:uncharacterized Zn finger protein
MKQADYTKTVLKKMDENNEITCEDCGKKDKIGHGIVDNATDTIKMVCHECFKNKYHGLLYSTHTYEA